MADRARSRTGRPAGQASTGTASAPALPRTQRQRRCQGLLAAGRASWRGWRRRTLQEASLLRRDRRRYPPRLRGGSPEGGAGLPPTDVARPGRECGLRQRANEARPRRVARPHGAEVAPEDRVRPAVLARDHARNCCAGRWPVDSTAGVTSPDRLRRRLRALRPAARWAGQRWACWQPGGRERPPMARWVARWTALAPSGRPPARAGQAAPSVAPSWLGQRPALHHIRCRTPDRWSPARRWWARGNTRC